MAIDITKLALKAARAAIGDSAPGSAHGSRTSKPKRKKRTVKDHLPPAGPLLTGAAIAVAGRAAVRSQGGDWLQALKERLGVDDFDGADEDCEPEDTAEPEIEAEDDAEDDAEDEPQAAEDTEPEAEEADEPEPDDTEHGRRRRVTAVASPRRMSPVRVRKLAESARRARA